MATVVAHSATRASGLPGRRFDHLFFSAMAGLLLLTVFIGFAHSYYLAGIFHAPLPSLITHLHGALFSCWIVLFVTQTLLAAAGRVDIHRILGIAGFLLACLMVIVGVLVATDFLARSPVPDTKMFYIIPLTDILIFGTLVAFAFRARSHPPAHKRLILVATITLMGAALFRWPFPFVHHNVRLVAILNYLFLLMLVIYDLWSTRKIHRATLWASAFLIFVEEIRLPIGHTAAWHSFAAWVQSLAK